MRNRLNNAGMTLLEVIAALIISAIIGGITITIILTSTNYFFSETSDSHDKLMADQIVNYVRRELLYSSEIVVGTSKPDTRDWNYITINDGRLIKNDVAALSEGTYGDRKIVLSIRGYDSYRLDLNLSLNAEDQSNLYSTKSTLELLNLKLKAEIDSSFNPFGNIGTSVTIDNTVKIYYIKDFERVIIDDEVKEARGLVSSQISFLDNYNNLGVYDTSILYKPGSFVFYEGKWYMRLIESNTGSCNGVASFSSTARCWKIIQDDYSPYSAYQKGDIIIYNGKYYQATTNSYTGNYSINYMGSPPYYPWTEVNYGVVENTVYENTVTLTVPTVRNILDTINVKQIPEYDQNVDYSLSSSPEFVKKTIVSAGVEVVSYYQHCRRDIDGVPGLRVNGVNGWKTLSVTYDSNSYYTVGDVVNARVNNVPTYVISTQEMITQVNVVVTGQTTDKWQKYTP